MKQNRISKLYTVKPINDESYFIVEMPITKVTQRTIHCGKNIFDKKTLIDTKNTIRAFASKELLAETVNKLITNSKLNQTMKKFEIELNGNLYFGWYEVADKQLFLHNVTRWLQNETVLEVKSPSELKQVEEAIENGKDSDDIAEERQEIFFVKNGRMPLREYDF